MAFSAVTGVLAASLSGLFTLAQVIHIVRRRSTAGLSDVAWLLLVLLFATLLVWGLLQADPYLISTSAVSLTGALWVIWRIHRNSHIAMTKVVWASAAVAAAFGLQVLGGTAGALISVLTITGYIRARQQKTARTATDLSGVALAPWVISSAAQVLWFAHALAAGKVVVVVNSQFAFAANVVLLLTIQRRRRELQRS